MPIGLQFPFNNNIWSVLGYDFEPISRQEHSNLNPIVEKIMIIGRLSGISPHKSLLPTE